MDIDWSKAPKDATHFLPETEEYFACWIKPGFSVRVESQKHWVEDDSDAPEHLLIARPWNGEGRPPIGLEIECSYPMWGYWLKGKVLCYGEQMIFMEQESSKGNGKFEGSMNPDGIMFRPIRTPEQIAVDDIKQIAEELGVSGEFVHRLAIATVRAGYRKRPTE